MWEVFDYHPPPPLRRGPTRRIRPPPRCHYEADSIDEDFVITPRTQRRRYRQRGRQVSDRYHTPSERSKNSFHPTFGFDGAEVFSVSPVERLSKQVYAAAPPDDGTDTSKDNAEEEEESSFTGDPAYVTATRHQGFPISLDGCVFGAGGVILDTIEDFTASKIRRNNGSNNRFEQRQVFNVEKQSLAMERLDEQTVDKQRLDDALDMASENLMMNNVSTTNLPRVLSLDMLEEEDLRRTLVKQDNATSYVPPRHETPSANCSAASIHTIHSTPMTPTTLRSPNESFNDYEEDCLRSTDRPITPTRMRSPANSVRLEPKDNGPPAALSSMVRQRQLHILTSLSPVDAPENTHINDEENYIKLPDAPPQLRIRIPRDDESLSRESYLHECDAASSEESDWDHAQTQASYSPDQIASSASAEENLPCKASDSTFENFDALSDADSDSPPRFEKGEMFHYKQYPSVEELEGTATLLEKLASAPSSKELHDARAYLAKMAKTPSPKELTDVRSFFEHFLEPQPSPRKDGLSPAGLTLESSTSTTLPSPESTLSHECDRSHSALKQHDNTYILDEIVAYTSHVNEPNVRQSIGLQRSTFLESGWPLEDDAQQVYKRSSSTIPSLDCDVSPQQVRHQSRDPSFLDSSHRSLSIVGPATSHHSITLADDSNPSLASNDCHEYTRHDDVSLRQNDQLACDLQRNMRQDGCNPIHFNNRSSIVNMGAQSEREISRKKRRTRSPSLTFQEKHRARHSLKSCNIPIGRSSRTFVETCAIHGMNHTKGTSARHTKFNYYPLYDDDGASTMGYDEDVNGNCHDALPSIADCEILPVDSAEPRKKLPHHKRYKRNLDDDLANHYANGMRKSLQTLQMHHMRDDLCELQDERAWPALYNPLSANRHSNRYAAPSAWPQAQPPRRHTTKGELCLDGLIEIYSEDSSLDLRMPRSFSTYVPHYQGHSRAMQSDDIGTFDYQLRRTDRNAAAVKDDLIEIISTAESSIGDRRQSARKLRRSINFPPFGELPNIPEVDDDEPDAELLRRKRELRHAICTSHLPAVRDTIFLNRNPERIFRYPRKGGPEEQRRQDLLQSDSSATWLALESSDGSTVSRQQPMSCRMGGPESLLQKKMSFPTLQCPASQRPSPPKGNPRLLVNNDDKGIDDSSLREVSSSAAASCAFIPRLHASPPRPDKQKRQSKDCEASYYIRPACKSEREDAPGVLLHVTAPLYQAIDRCEVEASTDNQIDSDSTIHLEIPAISSDETGHKEASDTKQYLESSVSCPLVLHDAFAEISESSDTHAADGRLLESLPPSTFAVPDAAINVPTALVTNACKDREREELGDTWSDEVGHSNISSIFRGGTKERYGKCNSPLNAAGEGTFENPLSVPDDHFETTQNNSRRTATDARQSIGDSENRTRLERQVFDQARSAGIVLLQPSITIYAGNIPPETASSKHSSKGTTEPEKLRPDAINVQHQASELSSDAQTIILIEDLGSHEEQLSPSNDRSSLTPTIMTTCSSEAKEPSPTTITEKLGEQKQGPSILTDLDRQVSKIDEVLCRAVKSMTVRPPYVNATSRMHKMQNYNIFEDSDDNDGMTDELSKLADSQDMLRQELENIQNLYEPYLAATTTNILGGTKKGESERSIQRTNFTPYAVSELNGSGCNEGIHHGRTTPRDGYITAFEVNDQSPLYTYTAEDRTIRPAKCHTLTMPKLNDSPEEAHCSNLIDERVIRSTELAILHSRLEEDVELIHLENPQLHTGDCAEEIEVVFVENNFLADEFFRFGEAQGMVFDWIRGRSDDELTPQQPKENSHEMKRCLAQSPCIRLPCTNTCRSATREDVFNNGTQELGIEHVNVADVRLQKPPAKLSLRSDVEGTVSGKYSQGVDFADAIESPRKNMQQAAANCKGISPNVEREIISLLHIEDPVDTPKFRNLCSTGALQIAPYYSMSYSRSRTGLDPQDCMVVRRPVRTGSDPPATSTNEIWQSATPCDSAATSASISSDSEDTTIRSSLYASSSPSSSGRATGVACADTDSIELNRRIEAILNRSTDISHQSSRALPDAMNQDAYKQGSAIFSKNMPLDTRLGRSDVSDEKHDLKDLIFSKNTSASSGFAISNATSDVSDLLSLHDGKTSQLPFLANAEIEADFSTHVIELSTCKKTEDMQYNRAHGGGVRMSGDMNQQIDYTMHRHQRRSEKYPTNADSLWYHRTKKVKSTTEATSPVYKQGENEAHQKVHDVFKSPRMANMKVTGWNLMKKAAIAIRSVELGRKPVDKADTCPSNVKEAVSVHKAGECSKAIQVNEATEALPSTFFFVSLQPSVSQSFDVSPRDASHPCATAFSRDKSNFDFPDLLA
ncbi:hypothetical protein MPSEU_000520900 [Mayamaea pseudoterrestris]|nr:hypothetical protein MPSEU_000520900 [Mayamaea pseudoterrestris]